jgi:hypothetical protein
MMKRIWLGIGLAGLAGCMNLSAADGSVPEGYRLVKGTLYLADEDLLGRQVTGLQVAAVHINPADSGVVATYNSAILDPEKGGAADSSAASFSIAVPDDVSFSVLLQVPRGSGRGPGGYVALLRFRDASGGEHELIPPGARAVDLGRLEAFAYDPNTVLDNALQVQDKNNPLAQIDSNDDGVSDWEDSDDDGDGIPDDSDPDVAGDGLDDASQVLGALADEDSTGVPDLFEVP